MMEKMNKIMIDLTHRIYYDSELGMVSIVDEKKMPNVAVNLSETAVLKMLDYMLIHGMRSNINRGTVKSEIDYRAKEQEREDRLEEYIQQRIYKEYYYDVKNGVYIHNTNREKVKGEEVRKRILNEIEYVSKLVNI